MKYAAGFLVIFIVTVHLYVPTIAHAEELTATPTTETTVTMTPTTTSEPAFSPSKEHRELLKNEIQTMRVTTKTALTQQKDEIQAQRKSFEDALKQKRDEFQASRSAERTEFKLKLQTLKDQRKKVLATKIDTKLSDINKSRTDQMAKALDMMSTFITKLQDKITVAGSSGKDTSAAQSALTAATTAIAGAQSVVTTQAAKTYTATITDESTLGQKFGSAFTTLMNDLKTTYTSINTARDALVTTAREVAKLQSDTEAVSSNSAQ